MQKFIHSDIQITIMTNQVLLNQNKILAYFTLDISSNVQEQEILQPSTYTTIIFHNHYPVVYFDEIYEHFINCLPAGAKPGNIRIYFQKKQLPSQMPLGLIIKQSSVNLTVGVQMNFCLLDAFKIIKNSWKKAFQVINPNRQCDYVKSRLSKDQLQQKYNLYKTGRSHNLHRQGLYEGAYMIVKGFFDDVIIERKYSVTQYPTMRNIVKQLFFISEQQLNNLKIIVMSHGIAIDLEMNSKVFLDEWNYNDGYCYLQLYVENSNQTK